MVIIRGTGATSSGGEVKMKVPCSNGGAEGEGRAAKTC